MLTVAQTCIFLAAAFAGSQILAAAADCGDVQQDVENGMIRLPDFSGEDIHDLNCSWTYTAPSGRKLLVKVDSVHLPPVDLRTSQFQLYVDDKFYDIPRNCVKCLREIVGGKVLNVIFTSYIHPFIESHVSNSSESEISSESIGSFQVRYKAFDPYRCEKPEQIENGFLINKGRKVGHSIFYHCNPPYDLIGDSELKCVSTVETPMPEWSSKTPKCVIQDCTGEPVVKRGSSGAIASPGYPNYIYQFTAPCIWEIFAQPHQQIKVSVNYLKFPKPVGNSFFENTSWLALLDGEAKNYIVNLTESLTSGPLNFTTLTNKLTVEFVVNEDPKRKEETGTYIEYSFISSSCPRPNDPENGQVIVYSTDLGSTIAYSCKEGFVLVGELHAECLFNGQWSHPSPTCEPLNTDLPPLLVASNDSDTVNAKLSEISSDIAKHSKPGKKKATESVTSKDVLALSEAKEKPMVPNTNHNVLVSPSQSDMNGDVKLGNNGGKGNGNNPKSQPHLLQVVPPKTPEKKMTIQENEQETVNASQAVEHLPTLNTDFTQDVSRMKFLMIYVIAGVGVPLLIITLLLVVIIVYRRRYPVRMRFGRKFSTFENPMYVSKDAHHPRELKRLTN